MNKQDSIKTDEEIKGLRKNVSELQRDLNESNKWVTKYQKSAEFRKKGIDIAFKKGKEIGRQEATAQVIKDVKNKIESSSTYKSLIDADILLKWLESYSKDTFGTTKLSIKDKEVEK